jgi:hypothetical protein
MSIWDVVAGLAVVWTVAVTVQTARRCFQVTDISLGRQLLSSLLSFAGFAGYVVLLDLEAKLPILLAAFVIGAGIGYVISLLAGYELDFGFAMIPGSGWFLIPWGITSAAAVAGALAESDGLIALAMIGTSASCGAGLGQLAFSLGAAGAADTEMAQMETASPGINRQALSAALQDTIT